jgi:hypothetical protein
MDIRRRGNKPRTLHAGAPVHAISDIRKTSPPTPIIPAMPTPETPQTPPKDTQADEPSHIDTPPVTVPTDAAPTTHIENVEPVAAETPTEKTPVAAHVTKTVEIKISLPAMPNLKPITEHRAYTAAKLQAAKLPRKKLALGGILLAVLLFFVGSYLLPNRQANVAADKKSGRYALSHGTPDYSTVLPKGKTIEELGGWTLVSPPDRDPAFAHIDKIGNTQINVSQQPLPKDFKPDTAEKIEQLAKNYGASEKITVGKIVVHIGTSDKGPQSVIFNKDDLLVLIKSSVRIDSNDWAKYVNSLE